MRKLVIALSTLLVLVCVGGCIPIGVRGSTMAGLETSPEAALGIVPPALNVQAPAVQAARVARAALSGEAPS